MVLSLLDGSYCGESCQDAAVLVLLRFARLLQWALTVALLRLLRLVIPISVIPIGHLLLIVVPFGELLLVVIPLGNLPVVLGRLLLGVASGLLLGQPLGLDGHLLLRLESGLLLRLDGGRLTGRLFAGKLL